MDGGNNPMRLEAYTFEVKNPLFKYAKLDKASGKYIDKYGNEQKQYIEKKVNAATMFDINKTVMRCLTKNLAMFGLGLALYAGEDLFDDPEGNKGMDSNKQDIEPEAKQGSKPTEKKQPEQNAAELIKLLDDYYGSRTPKMSKEEKDKALKFIESKIGMVNYRNCTDAVALKQLWDELNKEPNAA